MAGINLDALLGESVTRPLTYKGETFDLPGELPGATVAPFLNPDLGLIDIISDLFSESDTFDSLVDAAFGSLKKRPTLPLDLLAAAKDALDDLLGEEQAEAFYALSPSVPAYFVLAQHLVTEYGTSLADFFGLGELSESTGESSKEISNTTTASTPEGSGDAPETPASSESADSQS